MTILLEAPKAKLKRPRFLLISELNDTLAGIKELSELTGMSKANVSGTAKRRAINGFPDEVGRWRMGPGYLIDEVMAWRAGKVPPPRPAIPRRIPRTELIDVADIGWKLGGALEIAELLGISSTQTTTFMSRRRINGFPEAVWQPAMGSAHLLDEVWQWWAHYAPEEAAQQWKRLSLARREMLLS